jgi:uncharacterized protein involved in response to NO
MALQINGQVTSEKVKDTSWPFFNLAFRPFFWLGALFSVFSISMWSMSYAGAINFSPYGGSLFWHIHEMLFGFAATIMIGFLLTASQTWTGNRTINGKPLAALVILWLSARILMAFPLLSSSVLIMVIDLLFLPIAAVALALPIIKAKMWRNLIFVPIILVMTILNGLMHYSLSSNVNITFTEISHTMVLMIALVMSIIGGRVFPMFTANGTQTHRVNPIAWLEKLAMLSIIASIIASIKVLALPAPVTASIFVIAGIANLVRAIRWRFWITLTTPLLWSLHLAYFAMSSGLVMLGLTEVNVLNNASLAYHAITVGGMGLMILSMISRVSLGHTGRMIKVGKLMTIAFLLMALAFVVRVIAPVFFDQYAQLIAVSAKLWVVAYSAFVVSYIPVLFKARVDGRP